MMKDAYRITSDSIVDLIFCLKWKSDVVWHTECYQASRVNIWRDLPPPMLVDALMGKRTGERLQVPLKSKDIVAAFSDRNLFKVKNNQFDRQFRKGVVTEPRLGRFYPKGLLRGVDGIF
ncbi:MAG: hypothetical protein P8X68_13965, partial [Desulfobacterales bacterium]